MSSDKGGPQNFEADKAARAVTIRQTLEGKYPITMGELNLGYFGPFWCRPNVRNILILGLEKEEK